MDLDCLPARRSNQTRQRQGAAFSGRNRSDRRHQILATVQRAETEGVGPPRLAASSSFRVRPLDKPDGLYGVETNGFRDGSTPWAWHPILLILWGPLAEGRAPV